MKNFNFLDWTSLITLIIGGLNWGLVGFFGYNLVEAIFGNASSVIYAIVGISALYVAIASPGYGRKPSARAHRVSQQPI